MNRAAIKLNKINPLRTVYKRIIIGALIANINCGKILASYWVSLIGWFGASLNMGRRKPNTEERRIKYGFKRCRYHNWYCVRTGFNPCYFAIYCPNNKERLQQQASQVVAGRELRLPSLQLNYITNCD